MKSTKVSDVLRGICLQLKQRRQKKDKIAAYAGEIDVIQKYRRRIGVIKEGQKTLTMYLHTNKKKRIQN